MTACTPIRTAIIGLGWAGRSIWGSRLREHPAYEVTALVDPEPVARASASRDFPEAVALPDAAALRPGEVDLAVIAVPNHQHARVAADLLIRGVPVFVEKPVCLSTAEADTLAEAERMGGAVLLAGSAARYRADVRTLYGLAAGLGPIRHVDAAWVRAKGVPGMGGWFTSRRLAGGGALIDLGWHLLDAVAPLVGPGGYREVLGSVSGDFVGGEAWAAAWRYDDVPVHADGDVEDTARGFLISDSGVSVSLRASWASHEAYDKTVLAVEGVNGTARLVCTFGFSPHRHDGSTLTVTRDGATDTVPVAVELVGIEYRRQLDELPGLLADPAARGAAIGEARSTIEAIERLYASARRTPAVAVREAS
ncbi:Gfo/Idh/MocA family protein [Thermostaphylospora chromogena]|uniref:Oxidoreductase n=1 Tax=Thermostaphylospora chromogena TaxID=35622 RepID=A0A1H0ZQU3_9ACTN|nr:Gfo/Idh/MocA family oxidoreductase [Thermostaphylospora chromogena]SDQ29784.1 oxidoreductase [Thermostaphylospora chromogena]